MADPAAAPIPPEVARQAVHWLLELGLEPGPGTEQLHRQWQIWLAADPLHGTAAASRLSAGEQGRFTGTRTSPATPLPDSAGAWSEGMLVADDMPLEDFIAELARHRPGLLRCTPEAGRLRVSGAYPLADTDRVLAALTHTLPVQVRSRTGWWVTVELSD